MTSLAANILMTVHVLLTPKTRCTAAVFLLFQSLPASWCAAWLGNLRHLDVTEALRSKSKRQTNAGTAR
jgi:hypothetical protein